MRAQARWPTQRFPFNRLCCPEQKPKLKYERGPCDSSWVGAVTRQPRTARPATGWDHLGRGRSVKHGASSESVPTSKRPMRTFGESQVRSQK
jgi:hypothetical protein